MRVLLSYSPPWDPHSRGGGGLQNLTLSESGTEVSEPLAVGGGMFGGSLPCAPLPAGGSAHPSAAPRSPEPACPGMCWPRRRGKVRKCPPPPTKGQATGQCAWWGFVI